MDSLGFKPQKEIIYNRFLPYSEVLNDEAKKQLAEIKFNLGRAVALKEPRPGVIFWCNQLSQYLQIHGRKFSKEDHLLFVKLVFELLIIPDQDPQLLQAYTSILVALLKKKELISREDLELPWRPLYELFESVFYSKHQTFGLKRFGQNLEHALKLVIRVTRTYFPVSATQEMLDEWRPLLCPYDNSMVKAMFYFVLFLPTNLPPEQHDQGFKLWLDEFLEIWSTSTRSPWEGDLVKLISRAAKDNCGYIDWKPHLPLLFTRVMRSVVLPSCSSYNSNSRKSSVRDAGFEVLSLVNWIVYSLGGDSPAQDHLTRFFEALHSFFHPSNTGRHQAKLQKILSTFPRAMVKRLKRERQNYESWLPDIPQSHRLSPEDLKKFVECFKPIVSMSIFSKAGSYNAADALQNLALIKADIVLPPLLESTYLALETLTEPHQLTATLTCVTLVCRALISGDDQSFPEGHTHLLPLLRLVLPGIDPNDFRKAMSTFTLISTLCALVNMVDCSEAVGQVEMTEIEKEVCLATAQFEDFVVEYMDRCFSLIESSTLEQTTELNSSQNDVRLSWQENVIGMGLASSFHTILIQSSPQIFQVALKKLFRFCSSTVLETNVAGKMVGDMCRAAAKANAIAVHKLFIPHCCTVIKNIASGDEVQNDEEVGDDLLWNLHLLSQVLCGSGEDVLQYKDLLMEVLSLTVHIKAKKASKKAAKLFFHLIPSLCLVYPLEWKSLSDHYGKSPLEHLFIRDWGKSGDLLNMDVHWHIPSEEELLFVKEILDKFLQPELGKLEAVIDGEEITRDELHQSLDIICHCVWGAAGILKGWDSPIVTPSGKKSFVSTRRLPNTVSIDKGVDFGENIRQKIAIKLHKFLDYITHKHEDDTKSISTLIRIYHAVLLNHGVSKEEFDLRWKSMSAVKRAMEDKLAGKKKHVRSLLIERIHLQHEMRVLDQRSAQVTELHKVMFDDLAKLATSGYSEVRIKAQRLLGYVFENFSYSARLMVHTFLDMLKPNPDITHEQFKGALYLLQNSRMLSLVDRYWEIMVETWPIVAKAEHSEKMTIIALVHSLSDKLCRNYQTPNIIRTVPDSCISCARDLLESTNPAPCTVLAEDWVEGRSVVPTDEEMTAGSTALEERNAANLRYFQDLVENLADLLEGNKLRWRGSVICTKFLVLLIRYDESLPAKAVKLFVNFLNHDALAVRKLAIRAMGSILRQQKRPHEKIPINPYSLAGVSGSTAAEIIPGDRLDNKWLQYEKRNIPQTKEEWENCHFIDKPHWGYYSWPKELMVYAPISEQPALGRTRDQLKEEERPIFDAFTDKEFVNKAISFLSLEERKGKDYFDYNRFHLFKALFSNFDDSFLPLFIPHLEKFVSETVESGQRCAIEIISAVLKGSKHWSYEQRQKLMEIIIPVLKKALSNVTAETLYDWGTAMYYAFGDVDPRRMEPIIELLADDPLSGNAGSFNECSRLLILQSAVHQHEWKAAELLHRLMNYVKPRLDHQYQNVRERLGGMLGCLLMVNMKIPKTSESISPGFQDLIEYVKPKLAVLQEEDAFTSSNGEEQDEAMDTEPRNPVSTDLLKLIQDRADLDMGMDIDVKPFKNGVVSDEDSAPPRTPEEDHRKAAIRLAKTVMGCLNELSLFATGSVTFSDHCLQLLPMLIPLVSQEDDPELQMYCKKTLNILSHSLLPQDSVCLAVSTVKQIGSSSSWRVRKSILQYLQRMVVSNLFTIMTNDQNVQEIKKFVLDLLLDEQLEVREMASQTLSGLVHYGFVVVNSEIQELFSRMAKTKIMKKRKGDPASLSSASNGSSAVIQRHAGVLGLSACIDAFPYEVPLWMPQMLIELGDHLHDPHPMQATVKTTLSNFRRTHHDNWQMHKQQFTEDQLLMLTDLLVSPCYYA